MKLLLKFRQYCMILTAVPGRFRPRGIAVTENKSKVAVNTSLSRKNTLLTLLLGFENHKFDILFFPGLRKRDFLSRNAVRPLRWGRKLSNYITKGLEICKSFFFVVIFYLFKTCYV